MYAGLDGLEFLEYLWSRRWMLAATCAAALAITGVVSALLPSRYTATASVLIEPPGGNDPRAATAVSPVYLESLKTYELLASSDSLFAHALDDLQLRRKYPGASMESLKRRFLSLNKPANTSIIEISATLDNPRQAQALAQYLAEHTVQLNEELDEQSNQEILREPRRIYKEAVARRTRAEEASDEFARSTSLGTISNDATASEDLRTEVETQLARARAELAEDSARQQAPASGTAAGSQAGWTQLDIAAERARVQELDAQDKQLEQQASQTELALEGLEHTRDSLDAELKAARAAEDAAQAKLADIEASSAFRGVLLKVLDPSIVPQRPSFPNIPLNLVVAFVFSLFASVGFLTLRFACARIERAHADPVYSLRQ